MQPKIVYAMRAILRPETSEDTSQTELIQTKEVRIMPFSAPGPPLHLEDFPGELNEVSRRSLRQALWTRSLGTMKVSMKEPSPLNLGTMAPRASTTCYIKLSLKPLDAFARTIRPESWSLTVKSCLHVKTFYSTQPLQATPSLPLLRECPDIRHHSTFMEPESRRIDMLSWRLNRLSKYGTISKNSQPSWTTTIALPISAPKSLLPTFLSTLAARTYALTIKLRLLGVHHDPFELEVPLQMVYEVSTRTPQPSDELMEERGSNCWNLTEPPSIPDPGVPEGLGV